MRLHLTREEWLSKLNSLIEPVGECMEWQGPTMGKTPVYYSPRGYAFEGSAQGKHSTRAILFSLDRGYRLSTNSLIRMRCRNDKCVHEAHFYVIPRSHQPKEQSKRGELSTPRNRAAVTRQQRKTAKLTLEQARAIRHSTTPSREEAKKYGVSSQTVSAIRRGILWAESTQGASVFSWRGGL